MADPNCVKSKMETVLPLRMKDLNEKLDPRWINSRRDAAEPNLPQLLRLIDDPKCAQSSILAFFPMLVLERIETEDPVRAKALNDRDDPRWTKSSPETAEPNLHVLLNEKLLPKWANDKIDAADPSLVVATTDIDDPTRRKFRIDIELPSCRKSKIETAEPQRPMLLRLRLLTR